jgi:predicted DNA-binding protein with PD1-like motif
MFVVEVAAGEELLEAIAAQAKSRGVTDAAIVSLIGAVEGCAVSTMARDDPLTDRVVEYEQPLELSGTGEIRDGVVHVHVVAGAEGNRSICGHLHRARVKTFFARAYCLPVPPSG